MSEVILSAGQGRDIVVTIDRTEFSGTVTLSASGAPSGVTATFDPSTITGTTSMLLLSVDSSAVPGTYVLIVRGSGLTGSGERALALTVAPSVPGIRLTELTLTIAPGASGQSGVVISRPNFDGAVSLDLRGAPGGVTWGFDPVSTRGGASTVTVSVGPAVPPGVYSLTVLGASTLGTSSASLLLRVMASNPNFSVSLATAEVHLEAGMTRTLGVLISRAPGFSDPVALRVNQAPNVVTWAFDPAAPTGDASTLTLTAARSIPVSGGRTITIVGTSATGSSSTTMRVDYIGRITPIEGPP